MYAQEDTKMRYFSDLWACHFSWSTCQTHSRVQISEEKPPKPFCNR